MLLMLELEKSSGVGPRDRRLCNVHSVELRSVGNACEAVSGTVTVYCWNPQGISSKNCGQELCV